MPCKLININLKLSFIISKSDIKQLNEKGTERLNEMVEGMMKTKSEHILILSENDFVHYLIWNV